MTGDCDAISVSEIMESNFRFNLSLEEYARLCHRSLSSFKRDFQTTFQEPPGKRLLRKRLEYSAALLRTSKMNVTEIAFESGFEDVSHFSRVFKERLSVPSPMGWGDEATVRARLAQGFAQIRLTRRMAPMRYPFSPADTVEFFRQYYGPTQKAFASLDESSQAALRRDLVELQTAHNIATTPGTTEVAAEYLEVVAVRS